MAKTYYRTIWLSDTHLCSRDCQAEALLSFLKQTKSDYLYLAGDFIDIWQLKRRWYWPQTFNNIIHKILGRAKKGTRVVYIPGNHDEFFHEFVGSQFGGVQIRQQAIHTTADNRRLLVLHGDEFDVVVQCNKWLAVLGNAAYDNLILLNRVVNAVRRRCGLPYWSLAAYLKHKVKNAVKYIGSFEEAVVREAGKHKVDGVVCGHIHQPGIKQIGGLQYCNTGDWVENCSALVERHDGTLQIIYWHKEDPGLAQLPLDWEELDEELAVGVAESDLSLTPMPTGKATL